MAPQALPYVTLRRSADPLANPRSINGEANLGLGCCGAVSSGGRNCPRSVLSELRFHIVSVPSSAKPSLAFRCRELHCFAEHGRGHLHRVGDAGCIRHVQPIDRIGHGVHRNGDRDVYVGQRRQYVSLSGVELQRRV